MVFWLPFPVDYTGIIIPFFAVFFYHAGCFNIPKNAEFQGVFELFSVIFAGFKNMFSQHIFQQGGVPFSAPFPVPGEAIPSAGT